MGGKVPPPSPVHIHVCTVPLNTAALTEILVPVDGAILPAPAPAVLTSTRISARLKCVQEHSSPVNVIPGSGNADYSREQVRDYSRDRGRARHQARAEAGACI